MLPSAPDARVRRTQQTHLPRLLRLSGWTSRFNGCHATAVQYRVTGKGPVERCATGYGFGDGFFELVCLRASDYDRVAGETSASW